MGTRSTIAIEFADNSVSQIYCHWDGYLEHNGAILGKHYMDPFKVQELINLGDMSSLSETVDSCEFYMRDRREEDCHARRYKDVAEYFADCQQEEYDYILRNVNGTATWFVRCYATDGAWVELHEAKALQERMEEAGEY